MWKEIPGRRKDMCKGPEARKNKQECVRGLNIIAVELNEEVLNHLGFFSWHQQRVMEGFQKNWMIMMIMIILITSNIF